MTEIKVKIMVNNLKEAGFVFILLKLRFSPVVGRTDLKVRYFGRHSEFSNP